VKEVRVQEAVGMVLGHDLTKIVPGEYKGCAFKKGHVIRQDDLEELLNIGKENIYIMEIKKGQLHEDDAAIRLAAALCGPGTVAGIPAEGKVTITATVAGILKVKKEAIFAMNDCRDISIATLHGNIPVSTGEQVAGTRVIPLIVGEETVAAAEAAAEKFSPVLEVTPYRHHRVGLVTTGNEVFTRRIEDRFSPIVLTKLTHFPAHVIRRILVNDERVKILAAIMRLYEMGAQMIIVTGGMSVDPDDRTPAAIRDTGAEIITYGAPVLPGSMLMLAYLGCVPVVGLPGCVMYNKATVFDLILPRLFTGEKLTKHDFTEMAVGGLCNHCEQCRYPNCRFGKN
jgi:hypothetical protein